AEDGIRDATVTRVQTSALRMLRSLPNLYAERGQLPIASDLFRSSVAQADALVTVEPTNALWLEYDFRGRIFLARLLFVTGQRDRSEERRVGHQSACTLGGAAQR